jgi:hypothetical protein
LNQFGVWIYSLVLQSHLFWSFHLFNFKIFLILELALIFYPLWIWEIIYLYTLEELIGLIFLVFAAHMNGVYRILYHWIYFLLVASIKFVFWHRVVVVFRHILACYC